MKLQNIHMLAVLLSIAASTSLGSRLPSFIRGTYLLLADDTVTVNG